VSRPKPKTPAADVEVTTSATRQVFDALLIDIVNGTYASGSRLPSERDLAASLGASRPTLREALRRLAGWGLIRARRGSGIVVLPKRDWSLDVLPAYLRHGRPGPGEPGIGQLIRDMLVMRTRLISDLIAVVAPRLDPDKLGGARDALEAAWAARDTPEFHQLDLEVFRELVEAAGFLPALWLLNQLGHVYADVASRVAPIDALGGPPADYLESYHRFFAALQRGESAAAVELLVEYFDRHDARLLPLLAGMP
jgi:DNA-binding FadR family transcriptional regulator